MFYVKNLPVWERVLRFAVAAVLAGVAMLQLDGMLMWIAVASAGGMLLSALFGFCPACALVGRRLTK